MFKATYIRSLNMWFLTFAENDWFFQVRAREIYLQ